MKKKNSVCADPFLLLTILSTIHAIGCLPLANAFFKIAQKYGVQTLLFKTCHS
jgi:hypothetical protein